MLSQSAASIIKKSSSWNLVGTDRIPAGVQFEIRDDLWLPLGEIPLESGTTNFRTGVCSTEL